MELYEPEGNYSPPGATEDSRAGLGTSLPRPSSEPLGPLAQTNQQKPPRQGPSASRCRCLRAVLLLRYLGEFPAIIGFRDSIYAFVLACLARGSFSPSSARAFTPGSALRDHAWQSSGNLCSARELIRSTVYKASSSLPLCYLSAPVSLFLPPPTTLGFSSLTA